MADRNGYIGRSPGDSSVIVIDSHTLQLELQQTLLLLLVTLQVILMLIKRF